MMRRHLETLVRQNRGHHEILLESITKLSDAEVEAWVRLLQNIKEDSEWEGRRRGDRFTGRSA